MRGSSGAGPSSACRRPGFLLTAIVGMSSSSSPWLPDDGAGSSAPAIVGNVLAVALAVGLCVLVGLIWILSPRRSKAKPRDVTAVGPLDSRGRSPVGHARPGRWRRRRRLPDGAFWFLLEQANVAQPPPQPTVTSEGAVVTAAPPNTPASASPVLPLVRTRVGRLDRGTRALGLVVRHRRREIDAWTRTVPCPSRSFGRSGTRSTRSSVTPTLVARSSARTRGWRTRSTTRESPGDPTRPRSSTWAARCGASG